MTATFRIAYDVAVRRCDLLPAMRQTRRSRKCSSIAAPSKLLAVCDACYDARQPCALNPGPPMTPFANMRQNGVRIVIATQPQRAVCPVHAPVQ